MLVPEPWSVTTSLVPQACKIHDTTSDVRLAQNTVLLDGSDTGV